MMCGTLYMVSQLVHKQSALAASTLGFNVKEEEDDSEDEHYEDVPLDEVRYSLILTAYDFLNYFLSV